MVQRACELTARERRKVTRLSVAAYGVVEPELGEPVGREPVRAPFDGAYPGAGLYPEAGTYSAVGSYYEAGSYPVLLKVSVV
jgi:hypothetical protein